MTPPPAKPRCSNCKHPEAKHTTQPVRPCTIKVFKGWSCRGSVRIPVMKDCPCPRYKPEGED